MCNVPDITVIILTKDEKIHIGRAIENVKPIARRIIVVDSFSTDGTQEIARAAGAEVVEQPWPGNQAEQFNTALENIPVETGWILRLDADEWLSDELKDEIRNRLPTVPDRISAIELPLGRYFMGRCLKHGIVNGIFIIRLFRTGSVRYENRIMDEHLKVLSGETIRFKHKFFDDSRIPLSAFIAKHDHYALREAAVMLDAEFNLSGKAENTGELGENAQSKRRQKSRYARLPMFWRAFAYFNYRYIIRFGFLDGKEGFLWDFLQGFWYRTLVDAKIHEIKKACGNDPESIKSYLKDNGINF